ncbi:MAG: DinB family protein [Gemmatimonadetes bacterium]|nr:DinB family protein [Gemmatimonadota bacterium]
MNAILRRSLLAVATVAATSLSAAAQAKSATVGDLMKDVEEVHSKMVQLAKAMPAASYGWRPEAGVRSVSEVFLHVASDNYLMPTFAGVAMDPATKLSDKDFKTFETFEKQKMDQAGLVAALDKSFAHLAQAMAATTDAQLGNKVKMFGMEMSMRGMWIGTTTHLHEHLGQMIAYARANHVTPPWSKKG